MTPSKRAWLAFILSAIIAFALAAGLLALRSALDDGAGKAAADYLKEVRK